MNRRRKSAITPPSPKLLHRPELWIVKEDKPSRNRKTVYKSKSLPENLDLLAKKRHSSKNTDVTFVSNLKKENTICRTKSVTFQPEVLLVNAVSEDDVKETKRLLKVKNIDVNYRSASGQSVLHHAAYFGSINSLKLLLAKGANINAADEAGRTALDVAVRNGFFDCASELIQNGSKVEQIASGGDHW